MPQRRTFLAALAAIATCPLWACQKIAAATRRLYRRREVIPIEGLPGGQLILTRFSPEPLPGFKPVESTALGELETMLLDNVKDESPKKFATMVYKLPPKETT